MSVAPAEPTPAGAVPAATFTAPPNTEPSATAATSENLAISDTPSGDEDVPAVIKALREDFKTERAKRQAAEQKATDARTELAQTIGKALGLVEDEPIDPAKLTESLTVAQQEAKQAQVALAVYQNAGAVGDPVALLDSTTFLKSVAGIDPSDTAAITAAITSAVAANPRLGAAPADPRTPAPNPAQGSSAAGAPSLDAQIAAAQQSGDTKLAIHLQNQKLTPPRGA